MVVTDLAVNRWPACGLCARPFGNRHADGCPALARHTNAYVAGWVAGRAALSHDLGDRREYRAIGREPPAPLGLPLADRVESPAFLTERDAADHALKMLLGTLEGRYLPLTSVQLQMRVTTRWWPYGNRISLDQLRGAGA